MLVVGKNMLLLSDKLCYPDTNMSEEICYSCKKCLINFVTLTQTRRKNYVTHIKSVGKNRLPFFLQFSPSVFIGYHLSAVLVWFGSMHQIRPEDTNMYDLYYFCITDVSD